jgi:hypothetical protein
VLHRDGCDEGIGNAQRCTFLAKVTFQFASQASGGKGDGVISERREEGCRSASGYSLKASLGFLAEFLNPLGCALFEFRVVFFVPRNKFIKGFQLTEAHQLALGRLG